jgi:SAM-dependent MidA family methyltransferase
MVISVLRNNKAETSCVPLSKSSLWEKQRKFFEQQGVEAWNSQVPFYITTNPYIASCYAKIVAQFMQEQQNQPSSDPEEPFYILELGAGSGCFGFYFVKSLLNILQSATSELPRFKYVMTDFTRSNIDNWSLHPNLQPYIKEGYIDFALYDTESSQPIHPLIPSPLKNPLIVIANYVFDSIPHDAFRIEEGQLFEEHVVKSKEIISDEKEEQIKQLDSIHLTYGSQAVKLPYYNDLLYDSILSTYQKNLEEAYFLFPVGPLRCINSLLKNYGNRLFLLATDRGYSELPSFQNPHNVDLAHHASVSFLVNFHAIAEYVKQRGGYSKCSSSSNSIITFISMIGLETDIFNKTLQTISNFTQGFSPGDFFNLSRLIRQKNNGLLSILSTLRLSQWDPHIFNGCLEDILKGIDTASYEIKGAFLEGMKEIENNFYYMPGQKDTYFNQGLFCQRIGAYTEAIDYYKKSISYFGEAYQTQCK